MLKEGRGIPEMFEGLCGKVCPVLSKHSHLINSSFEAEAQI